VQFCNNAILISGEEYLSFEPGEKGENY